MACIGDTDSVDLTVSGSTLTADVKIDPNPTNPLAVTPGLGLFVSTPNVSGWNNITDTVTYAGADAPTYLVAITGDQTAKYEVGMRFRAKQTSYRYFIITGVAYNGGTGLTTLTLYGGNLPTNVLANVAITEAAYSGEYKPLGFSVDPGDWSVDLSDTAKRTQSAPVDSTWYNIFGLSLLVPIGVWWVGYQASVSAKPLKDGSDQYPDSVPLWSTLSVTPGTETDPAFSAYMLLNTTGGTVKGAAWPVSRERRVSLAAKAAHYLQIKSGADMESISFEGGQAWTTIYANCALL